MDKLIIKDLALRCIIGTFPEEREKQQDVIINITLYADLRKAGKSDTLEDTVNYKAVKQETRKFVEESDFQLIETLAAGIARIGLNDKRVEKVKVRVDKPGALRFAKLAAIVITRTRDDLPEL